MKKLFLVLLVAIGTITGCMENNRQPVLPEVSDSSINFIVANDLGRNGYYEQKTVAHLMGYVAENMDIEMVAAAGDIHHFGGVASVSDPLWMTNYELIYDHPDLMIDWNAICGNHEYRGNTQAMLDYSTISRRWQMPAKYYTKVITSYDGATCRLVFIDTAPLIDKYRKDSITYPDACKEDASAQLRWIDSVLVHAAEKWKIVIGHHPAYADTKKNEDERRDMQQRLAPLLEKHGVDVYFCGHIHNFQHIRPASSKVNYVVNSSGSLARKVSAIDGTIFCSSDAGFTVCSVDNQSFKFFFINHKGETIYSYAVVK
ncbi:MAG: metallophosphoesterase [Tannerellaceae bacterium]|nr:metallophosphoesterase [Tannerellaceae bacterium]